MIDYAITNVVLYDSILFDRTHHVGRWATSVARNFETAAKAAAPVNKRPNKSPWYSRYPVGSLKLHTSAEASRVGPKHVQVVLAVNVPYAQAVIKGTPPVIVALGDVMWLPRNPGFRKRKHFTVSGQRPNNFLGVAAAATAAKHPSLRGLDHLLYQQT